MESRWAALADRFVLWVRGEYPPALPRPGHVALVALCGQDRRPVA